VIDRDRPARVGIVGCGDVTNLYLPAVERLPAIAFVACADLDAERAAAVAAKGGFPAMPVEALLADPSIEVVLNLTPPTAHAAITRSAIAAGKHVYSEKPMATSRDDAAGLLAAADAAGVRLGSAPDTFLGGGLQTARAVLDDGAIGEPVLAAAAFLSLGPERWHHRPTSFYGIGAGPLLDVAPYYVTALIHLLGPVEAVTGVGRGIGTDRVIGAGPQAGERIVAAVPTSVAATLRFASGAVGSLQASFDAVATQTPYLEIHGTQGTLTLGDPNRFDGPVALRTRGDDAWQDVPLRFDTTIGRGRGLADLVEAIRDDRPARASAEFAFHVLDVLLAIEDATRSGRTETVRSTTARPAPLEAG
jgi:predicted dehydrogenase